MTKISGFIIGLLFVGFFAGAIGLFMAEMNVSYPVTTFNSSVFSSYDELTQLTNITNKTQARLEEDPPSNFFDVIDSFFSNGYEALKITLGSFDVFNAMANDMTTMSGLGKIGILLRNVLIAVVLVVLLFLILKSITKVDL